MKKYFLLALATLAFPLVAGANAITPKLGHYEGTATISGGGVERKISFDLSFSGQHYWIKHLHLPPNIFKYENGHVSGFWQDHREMRINVTDVVGINFKGHGKWEGNTRVAGDFREYPPLSPFNTYYTWHAHWKHH